MLAGEGFGLLRLRLCKAAEGDPGAAERIALAYLDFAREHRAYYRVMYLPEVTRPENLAHAEASANACFEMLEAVLVRTEPDPGRVRTRALALWSLLHGMVSLASDGGPLTRKLTVGTEALLVQELLR